MPPMDAPPAGRVLVVMRHAKAESWGESDRERPLSAQGTADASAAGRWLADRGFVPDHALVSSALRTRETWTAMSDAAGWDLEPALDDGLYAAGPDTALDLIRAAPDEARTLLVLGHNPTIAYLAQVLDDGEGDPVATADMAAGYPTCALTMLSFDRDWADLDMATASVTAFHVARG